MRETQKVMVFLGLSGGAAMLIGSIVLFLQKASISGHQFHSNWSGTGENTVSEGALSWEGLVFMSLICLVPALIVLFNNKKGTSLKNEM